MDLREALTGYIPYNEQEEKDREQILKFLELPAFPIVEKSRNPYWPY